MAFHLLEKRTWGNREVAFNDHPAIAEYILGVAGAQKRFVQVSCAKLDLRLIENGSYSSGLSWIGLPRCSADEELLYLQVKHKCILERRLS